MLVEEHSVAVFKNLHNTLLISYRDAIILDVPDGVACFSSFDGSMEKLSVGITLF